MRSALVVSAAARQRKVDIVPAVAGVSVADGSDAKAGPEAGTGTVASNCDDSSLTVDEPRPSTSATERKFALVAGSAVAGETEGDQ